MAKLMMVLLVLVGTLSEFVFSAQTSVLADTQVSLSYYGESLVHPGLRAELLAPLATDHLSAVMAGVSVGGYWHRMNESAAHLAAQVIYRLTLPVGPVFEFEAGAGYRHVFLDGVVYELVGNDAAATSHGGHPQILSEANLGLGWRFDRGDHDFLLLALKFGVFGAFPVNYVTIWHPVFQLTATVPLSSLGAP